MPSAQLSVLLATRNGQHVLPRTLEGYCRAIPPSVPWKLIVVDNGSTDSTGDILRAAKMNLPLEVVEHSVAGKNRALNAGVAAIEGPFSVIADDDAVPNPAFLTAWERFLSRHEEYELFGGRIAPRFDELPPPWVSRLGDQFALMFAERDLPEGPVAADEIYGANMAVRTAVFARGFRFLESIGPNADDPLYPMGSEVEFCRRIARSGVLSWFARGPHVAHIVRPHQCTEAAWIDRAYRCGRGRARLMWEEGNNLRPPPVSLADRFAMLLPLRHQRVRGRCAVHLARGFYDECTVQQKRRSNSEQPA